MASGRGQKSEELLGISGDSSNWPILDLFVRWIGFLGSGYSWVKKDPGG